MNKIINLIRFIELFQSIFCISWRKKINGEPEVGPGSPKNRRQNYLDIYPRDPHFRHYRHLPLSSFKNDPKAKDDPNQNLQNFKKKIYFHKNVVQEIIQQNFKYTEIPQFYKFHVNKFICDNFTIQNDLPKYEHKQNELPSHIFGNKLKVEKYFRNFFKGPLYNFDIRRSTLSNTLGFEIFGVFSREFIPKYSMIGNYVGFQMFGSADLSAAGADDYSDKGYEYTYNGARDSIDSAYHGNFLRYVNHQDAPTVQASEIYIPTRILLQQQLINQKLAESLPTYVEAIAFTTIENIYPGQEIFVDYGDQYWESREISRVRQLTTENLSRHISRLEEMVSDLRIENESLQGQIDQLKDMIEGDSKNNNNYNDLNFDSILNF